MTERHVPVANEVSTIKTEKIVTINMVWYIFTCEVVNILFFEHKTLHTVGYHLDTHPSQIGKKNLMKYIHSFAKKIIFFFKNGQYWKNITLLANLFRT